MGGREREGWEGGRERVGGRVKYNLAVRSSRSVLFVT